MLSDSTVRSSAATSYIPCSTMRNISSCRSAAMNSTVCPVGKVSDLCLGTENCAALGRATALCSDGDAMLTVCAVSRAALAARRDRRLRPRINDRRPGERAGIGFQVDVDLLDQNGAVALSPSIDDLGESGVDLAPVISARPHALGRSRSFQMVAIVPPTGVRITRPIGSASC